MRRKGDTSLELFKSDCLDRNAVGDFDPLAAAHGEVVSTPGRGVRRLVLLCCGDLIVKAKPEFIYADLFPVCIQNTDTDLLVGKSINGVLNDLQVCITSSCDFEEQGLSAGLCTDLSFEGAQEVIDETKVLDLLTELYWTKRGRRKLGSVETLPPCAMSGDLAGPPPGGDAVGLVTPACETEYEKLLPPKASMMLRCKNAATSEASRS